ncbi:hypothetical protein [Sinomicrobium sp.]
MKIILKKTILLFCIGFVVTSCSKEKEENQDKEAKGECWYKVTIDGQTTLPNKFGQDYIVLNAATGPDGKSSLNISIGQTKANGDTDPVFDFMSEDGVQFDRDTPVGTTYTANFFHALQLSVGEFDGFEYDKGRFNNKGEITLTVKENSGQWIQLSITGTVIKWEGGVENSQEVGMVSVEAEFSLDRTHYNEITSGGVFVTGVNCDCDQ